MMLISLEIERIEKHLHLHKRNRNTNDNFSSTDFRLSQFKIGIIGAVVLLLICILLFTRFRARKLFEQDHPDDTRKKQAIKRGRIFSSIVSILGIAGIVIVIVIGNSLPTCTLPQVLRINNPECLADTITIDGSTALQPLVQKIAENYTSACPASKFNVYGSTSEYGLLHVEDGYHGVVIGDSDILASSNNNDLVDHVVAVTIFCVIINKDLKERVTNLTTNNLQDIYNGHVTDWQHIAGGQSEQIKVFSRLEGSGTREAFQKYVLGGKPEGVTTPNPPATTPELIQDVANTPGAIGYADLYDVLNAPQVTPVSIDGVQANTATVIANNYHFWSLEHMYTKGKVPPLALDLIGYMNSLQGRTIARSNSYIGIADMTNFSSSGHCLS